MAAVTLTTLRTRARERADMVGSSFVADSATGLDAWINEGNQRLHGKLVEAFGDEYVESTATFNTVAGTSDYSLASDFFKLYGVDLTVSGVVRTLRPFMRAQRGVLTATNPSWRAWPRYRVVGSKLRFLPIPQEVLSAKVYYAPSATALVNASDSVDYNNGWEQYIVLYAAIQALLKEESDVRDLRAELAAIESEIARLRDDRDAALPRQVVDMDEVNLDWGW